LCTSIREDGRWIDAGEDDERIVARVASATPGVLQGVFGYSFLAAHADRLDGLSIEGVDDTLATIASGRYPMARPLFVYVKKPNLRTVPGLQTFVDAYVAALGPDGYLAPLGLAPLAPEKLEQVRAAVRSQVIMTRRPQG
jgi:phosphate transport system substrate-binding protein